MAPLTAISILWYVPINVSIFLFFQGIAEINNRDPSFKQLFHHGEQSLLDYLEQPETIQKIVLQLKQHHKFVHGGKFYGLILNIYSPRYPCENCEPAILGEQNALKSPFLILLKS